MNTPTVHLSLVWLYILEIICVKDLAEGCNLTALNNCAKTLSRHTDINFVHDGIFTIPRAAQLQNMCEAMNEFQLCYRPKALDCAHNMIYSLTFGTLEKTVQYLCLDGYKDIIKYESCWNQSGVSQDSAVCHAWQSSTIHSLQQMSSTQDSTQMKTRWCNLIDNTTVCMTSVVKKWCGAVPSCIMHTMMSTALEGLAGLMQCPVERFCNVKHVHDDSTIGSWDRSIGRHAKHQEWYNAEEGDTKNDSSAIYKVTSILIFVCFLFHSCVNN